jgi:polysaccharide export outer membrane protein
MALRTVFLVIFLLGVGLLDGAAAANGPRPGDYVIGPGDQLGIEVWKDPALTRSVVVLSDGTITFPLIGDVVAGGRTVAELRQEIEKRLSVFVPEPVLTMEVKQCNSLFVFVLGRVNTPGRSTVLSTVNVLQALAMAGGLNPFAKRDQIKIFRSRAGKTEILSFDYDEVIAGHRLEQNVELSRGDVVVVP